MDSNAVKPSPLVSVLMTAYNREKYIAEAIESVLASSYYNFELIIVDDCSIDKTVEIAKSYEAKDNRIKVYINKHNLGDYPNRNMAASYATGKYIKYLDSDDLIYRYGLEVMVNSMEKFPEAVLGITSRNSVPFKPFPILLTPQDTFKKHFFEYGFLDYGPSGTIIKRKSFELNGRFSGKRLIGDVECWTKMAMINCIVELPPSLTFWRRHSGQEFNVGKGKIDEGYFIVNFHLLMDILKSENCPLDNQQKQLLIKKYTRMYLIQLFKYFLKSGDLVKCLKIYKILRLELINLI
jgi:glycosyltransferase involved in cell wall biosynthesis